MKKFFWALGIAIVIVVAGYWFRRPNSFSQAVIFPTPTVSVLINQPAVLIIPKLGIRAPIEAVGVDETGTMAAPANGQNVAWFKEGYRPGEQGNAVIAGHLDNVDGSPAVFYNLSQLTKGDVIRVKGVEGKVARFVVTGKGVYPANSFPMQATFGSNDQARLNLITCEGDWDNSAQLYSDRLVVFSRLLNPDTP